MHGRRPSQSAQVLRNVYTLALQVILRPLKCMYVGSYVSHVQNNLCIQVILPPQQCNSVYILALLVALRPGLFMYFGYPTHTTSKTINVVKVIHSSVCC